MPMVELVSLVSKHLLFPTVPGPGELVVLLSSYMDGSSKMFLDANHFDPVPIVCTAPHLPDSRRGCPSHLAEAFVN